MVTTRNPPPKPPPAVPPLLCGADLPIWPVYAIGAALAVAVVLLLAAV